MEKYIQIAKSFGIDFKDLIKNESGNINDTFLVIDKKNKKYTLQEINTYVFPDVDKLMSNIVKVTNFQRNNIIKLGGNPERECLNFLKCGDKYYCKLSDGSCYRMYLYVDDARTYQVVEEPMHLYNAGLAFGNFQNTLAKFPAKELYETIPNFHNTKIRYEAFLKAVENNLATRKDSVIDLISFVITRKDYTSKIVNMLENGEIPYKVTHNDTKFNNVLIDNKTDKAICVIDLDTIMPGSSLYDFGDAIRFGTNTAAEDEHDLSLVSMNMTYFEMFTKGYLESLKNTITQKEKENLAFSAILITLECGMRFLTDYLNGDKYFKIRYFDQNLYRTKTQFKLVEEMENNYVEMQEIIEKYS